MNIPKKGELGYMPGELETVMLVKIYADQYGYGNLISHLQQIWSEKLQADGLMQQVLIGGAGINLSVV
jgi:hypothetical protein